jgi:hypothetical protein
MTLPFLNISKAKKFIISKIAYRNAKLNSKAEFDWILIQQIFSVPDYVGPVKGLIVIAYLAYIR